MNSQLYFNTDVLLSGQNAPCTGVSVVASRSNEMAYTIFTSGVTGTLNLTLSYPSPFFVGDYIDFYSVNITGNGYTNVLYMTTPIPAVRAKTSGVGYTWVAVTQRN